MSIETRTTKGGKKRYDVRIRDANGDVYTRTFHTKREAETFEARQHADRSRGAWVDPRRASITLERYAHQWMTRPDLRPRTRETYSDLLRLHILPPLGRLELGTLSPSAVRQWRAAVLEKGLGPTTVAKAYRLLHAILATAVQDEVIHRNPCVIKGAGVEHAPERPIATVAEVWALADAVPDRYRALVLLAAFAGLRRGELLGLRRRDVDPMHGTVTIERQHQHLRGGRLDVGRPKTDAGVRTIALSVPLVEELDTHLAEWVDPEPDALLFLGERDGNALSPRFWQTIWSRARTSLGLGHLHFHDLRHTGNTLAAATGATTRELMYRMGHASPRAALIYQHATRDRDAAIAAALADLIKKEPAPVVSLDDARDGRAMDRLL